MRKLLSLSALGVLLLSACSGDVTAPADGQDPEAILAEVGAYSFGMLAPGDDSPELRRLKALPAPIALTAAQEAAITKLIADFQAAYKADLDRLAELSKQAKEAIAAGKTRQEVAPLFAEMRPLRVRVTEAMTKLRADIQGVLTDQQKAWLASGSPNQCYPTVVAPLSADQRAAIQALYTAHREATKADRETVAAGMEAAKAARAAGKTRAEIQAILDSIKDELERLQAAGAKLRADVEGVLTPEQKAAGCFGPGARK